MATGATHSDPAPPPVQAAQAASRQPSRHEQAIGSQLSRTGRQVKSVELGSGLLMLGAGMLSFLMLAAVIDHWAAPLSPLARWFAFSLLAIGSIWWIAARLVPLAIRKVNPLYAAHTLETAEPSLKNSLINFLMLRQQGHVRPVILQGIEVHAARGIQNASIETAVDRSKMIRVAIVLTAIMVAASAYLFISPKSPLSSFARVATPWSDIAAPTRVTIKDIQPGDTTVFLGSSTEITALVSGQGDEEPVHLVYSTVDGSIIDAREPMTLSEGDPRWHAELPPGGGVRQEMTYHLECGDARSPMFAVAVQQAPSIVVESVEYIPPAYTGRAKRTVEGEGDLSGLEGAEIVLHAVANRDMERAQLHFDPELNSAAVGQKLTMEIDGRHATVRFKLRLTADRRTPWHNTYQLFFETPEGESSQQGIRHTIKVLPDLPPEVEVLQPEQREIQVPENSAVELQVRAIDPDFGLSRVWLSIDARGQLLRDASLWDGAGGESRPQIVETYRFVPAQMELKAGDVAIVVAHAADNRHSPVSGSLEPSTARTPNYRITIIEPVAGEQQEQEQAQGDEGDEGEGEEESSEGDAQGDNDNPEIPQGDPTRGEDESSQGSSSGDQQDEEQQGDNDSEQSDEAEGGGGQGGGSSDSAEGESEDSEGGEGGAGGSSESSGEEEGEGAEPTSEPVASDGSADGRAIERVAERLQQELDPQNQSSPEEQDASEGEDSEAQPGQADPATQGEQTPSESSQQAGSSQEGASGEPSAGERLEQIAENFERLNDQQGSGGDEQQPQGAQGNQPPHPEPGSPEAKQRAEQLEDFTQQLRDLKDQIESGQGGQDTERAREAMERIEEQVREQQERSGEQLDDSDLSPEERELVDALEELDQALAEQEGQSPEDAGEEPGSEQGAQEEGAGEQEGSGQQQASGDQQSGGDQQRTGEQQAGSQQQPGGEQQAGSQQQGGSEAQEAAGPQGQQGSEDNGGGGETPEEDNNAGTEATQRPQSTSDGQDSPPNEEGSGGGTSVSEHESDGKTQGEDGSHSGQGGAGAGEQSDQAGHDTPGSNTPSDEGAGAADEPGEGETGNQGGQGEESADPTGEAGDEAGEGSTSQGGAGSQAGGDQQPAEADDSQEQPADEGETGNQPSGANSAGEAGENESESQGDENQSGTPSGRQQARGGGGTTSGDVPPQQEWQDQEEEWGMEANLDYARETTDLVLEYLRDQEHDPNEELLKELGWTPEQLRDFLQRMEGRRSQAQGSEEDQRDYAEFLDSLGLVPPQAETRREERGGEDYGQADSGTNSQAPSEYYQRAWEAYGRALNRGGE